MQGPSATSFFCRGWTGWQTVGTRKKELWEEDQRLKTRPQKDAFSLSWSASLGENTPHPLPHLFILQISGWHGGKSHAGLGASSPWEHLPGAYRDMAVGSLRNKQMKSGESYRDETPGFPRVHIDTSFVTTMNVEHCWHNKGRTHLFIWPLWHHTFFGATNVMKGNICFYPQIRHRDLK